jgi:bifunctional UDP-N-acetylglucosamine pyrophosphorylase/glucosamine-1-phosphate N-acetyltransferase
MTQAVRVVVLAAGQGKRMHSALPKVLHPVCGRPMLGWVLEAALELEPERVIVVVGHGRDEVQAAALKEFPEAPISFVVQEEQLGTGHAVECAAEELKGFEGAVVVLCGDMPLLRTESLAALLEARSAEDMAMLTSFTDSPTGYGRIVRGEEGELLRIVEERDASAEERLIPEINSGVYAFGCAELLTYLGRVESQNDQGERYLTDVPGMYAAEGRGVELVELLDADEGAGVNSLADLAEVRWGVQLRILEQHLSSGVHIEDPATTYIDHGVEIGSGTAILPCTVLRGGVRVGSNCEVGPFTHLREGTVLEDGAQVGNFTECKKSTIGAGSKAKHLSYLGDAVIGKGVNIGAGTIFANYDGVAKHKTLVGDGAFVGSGTTIVAPNEIGAGATTGAGAVVTRSAKIGDGEVWIGVPARKLESGNTQGNGGESPQIEGEED